MRTDFDYSMMSTFMNCRRKYDYRINRGLVGKEPTMPLYFGGAIHKALDTWYITKDVRSAVIAFNKNYIEDLERDTKRTNEMGEWIIRNYDKQYVDQPWKLIHSEMTFELPLPNCNNFIGKIDKIIEWDGVLWVVDHKTTSQLGPQFFKSAEPNMQFTGYVWAAKKLGFDVKGIVLDAVLVAKGLLQASSRARLTPLARFDVYRSQEHLDEWEKTVRWIQSDIRTCEVIKEWYPNFDSCTYYGECPYRKVCLEDKDVRERVIEADYVVDHWDPRGIE